MVDINTDFYADNGELDLPQIINIYEQSPDAYSKSRYKAITQFKYDDGKTLIGNCPQVRIPKTDADEYHTVTHAEVGRLDIISTAYYQTPEYWWAIAYASNIFDPLNVQEGTVVRIPPIVQITKIKGIFTK